ncbi:MAG: molybdopterin-dependent oxidoreductase [Deltaproteobacteria bacterium]|nr:molybdopterin-dependent oxidoreductase [Deltaproteobacteria bacterium]
MDDSRDERSGSRTRTVLTTCSSHCGGRCTLKVHVKDGVIQRIETAPMEEPRIIPCLRGRAYRQRVYDPGRILFPMKRAGERGEGKFERISWDAALDEISGQLKRIRGQYGPSALTFLGGGGDQTQLHTAQLMQNLLEMTGGLVATWGIHSFEGGLFAAMATYGTKTETNDFDDLLNSRLILMWGWDPATSIHEANTTWYLKQAKESGTRILSIDPKYTDSAAILADQWIPIIPGTDTAMMIAMAYVMIQESLQDQAFLDKYTVGFERFKDYVLGREDGIAKTPAWAEGITGVPAETIIKVAREYATTKPAALVPGCAAGRTAYGEQYHRAAHVLSVMTGNVGVHGGWAGKALSPLLQFGGFDFKIKALPQSGGNPFDKGKPYRKDALQTGPPQAMCISRLHFTEVPDAILKGKPGVTDGIRMMIVMNTNPVNQFGDTNRMVRALKKLEFMVVAEQVMSATARFADILLPTATIMEKNDVSTGGATPFYGFINKVIEPLGEAKSQLEIVSALGEKLGVRVFGEKTDEEWLREMLKESYVPDYDEWRGRGIYRVPLPEPRVAFKEQIDDPENNPFPTPSGRIEIYSQRLAEMENPEIPPIPKYIEPWESRRDPLADKYPLQLITTHFKRRAHSQFECVPWLRDLLPQALVMNSQDAKERGVKSGDEVRVFNDRGEVRVLAMVTERIMPGVVDLPQGAWYDPDENGIDRGGCANVLTRGARSPGGATVHNTGLVQVEKV